MKRYQFVWCLIAFIWGCGGAAFSTGCGEEFTAQPADAGTGGDAAAGTGGTGGNTGGTAGTGGTGGNTGGTAGTGGTGGNTGGTAGTGGTGGSAGEGGTAGTGGTGGNAGGGGTGGGGGDPCSASIYLVVADPGGNTGNASSGYITRTTYDIYGTSAAVHLDSLVSLVNNVSGDFTVPQPTAALSEVHLRCADPFGGVNWTVVCPMSIATGRADCPAPGCYSASSGVIQMQIQIDPVAAGQVRIGIDPTFTNICGGQANIPVTTINP